MFTAAPFLSSEGCSVLITVDSALATFLIIVTKYISKTKGLEVYLFFSEKCICAGEEDMATKAVRCVIPARE